jgi:negative regulator of sigma E activity
MTEHIKEHISAFIDDELSAEECAFLVRRLGSDPDARSQLMRYAAIGSALRQEFPAVSSNLLRDRLRASLDGAEPLPVKRPPLLRRRRWAYPLAGAGIAASVAVAALFGLRFALDGAGSTGPLQAAGMVPTSPTTQVVAPASYVVPVDSSEPRAFSPPIRLTNYLVQHGNYASTLQRTSVHSNLVGIAKPDATTADTSDADPVER